MNNITGWFVKQKMGSVTDKLPEIKTQKTGKELRADLKKHRAERDEQEGDKPVKKLSVADRWAKNKAANRS